MFYRGTDPLLCFSKPKLRRLLRRLTQRITRRRRGNRHRDILLSSKLDCVFLF